MTSLRIRLNMVKGTILTILYVVLFLYSIMAEAQSLRSQKMKFRGLDGTFGFRVFTLDSDLSALDKLSVVQEGGSIGAVFGNRVLRSKVGLLGFFYSSPNIPRTVNVFENEAALNFFPLEMKAGRKVIDPYLAGGVLYNNVKFKGHYAGATDRQINTSAPEPTIGSIRKIDLALGTGVEIIPRNYGQFVRFFVEAKYGFNLYQDATDARLSATSVSNQLLCNAGLRFGSF